MEKGGILGGIALPAQSRKTKGIRLDRQPQVCLPDA